MIGGYEYTCHKCKHRFISPHSRVEGEVKCPKCGTEKEGIVKGEG